MKYIYTIYISTFVKEDGLVLLWQLSQNYRLIWVEETIVPTPLP